MDYKFSLFTNILLAFVITFSTTLSLQTSANNDNYGKLFVSKSLDIFEQVPSIPMRDNSVITLTEHVADLNEGETVQLHASTSIPGATIGWISFNTATASVSNAGVVTAIKADSSPVSVLAYVLDGNNNLFFDGCQIYVKIPDGTYYFNNKSSGLCADSTGYWAGSEVLQWFLHGGLNQRWTVNYISNGEYSIKNGMSGLYLGVESLNSTSARATQYSNLNDLSKWYISKTSSGAYCLYAKGNLSCEYVIGSSSAGNTAGTSITNMLYSNDLNYQDEWILEKIQLNYINYFDSSFANSSGLVSKILGSNTFSYHAFKNQFGIFLGTLSTSRKYDILCDQCTTGTNTECDEDVCGDSCSSNHHKNYKRISDQLYNSQLTGIITCLWTNRNGGTFCYEDPNSGEHRLIEDGVVAAVAELGRPVIQFFQVDSSADDTEESLMGITLVHETAHSLGLPEQYRYPTYEDPNPYYNTHNLLYYNSCGYTCVMMEYHSDDAEDFYEYILDGGDAFCPGCYNYLATLISSSTD